MEKDIRYYVLTKIGKAAKNRFCKVYISVFFDKKHFKTTVYHSQLKI